MRPSLLVTVTNYLGSTQFYLTITHQRIVIVGLLLAALSLVVGNSVLVWLGNAHNKLLQQAESMQLEDIQSKDKIQKLQTSVAKLLPASKSVEAQGSDFETFLQIAPAAAASLEELQNKAIQDEVTIQALESRLGELVDSQYQVKQQLERYTQKVSSMDQSLRQLQGLLGEQVGDVFDLSLVPQMVQTAQHKLILLALIPNSWPMAKKSIVTSSYGPRLHPITGTQKMHKGIDIRCLEGSPILATANGVVAKSYKMADFGNLVELTHSYGFSSRYAHLQKRLVRQAEFVYKGQVIGLCGSSGLSTAPHLHYEIKFLSKQSNPKPFINWSLSNFDGLFQQVQEVQWQSLIKPTQPKTTKVQQ